MSASAAVPRLRTALFLALIALLSIAAAASARTLIFTQAPEERFVGEPERLIYTGFPIIVGETVDLKRIEWRDWGKRKARASAKLKRCANMSPCERSRAKLVASGLARNAEGQPDDIYTYLRIQPKDGGRSQKLCLYAEVCNNLRQP